VPVGSVGPDNRSPQLAENQIRFQPLAELRAGESVSFRVAARGVAVGAAQVTAEITSIGQVRPLSATTDTRVIAGEE
jgi:hypothetical protein